MKAAYTFEAEAREKLGRGAARELRRNKRIPAVLYSNSVKPVSFSIAENEFGKIYHKGGLRSKLAEIKVGKETYYALAREIQAHPVSDRIEHIDFLQVESDSVVSVAVPLKVVGTEKSIGVKRGGSINVVKHTVKLVCNPENIPTSIEADVSEAGIGDSIHISAVKLPEGVHPAIQDRDFTVVTIAGRLQKEEEVTVAPEASEVPVDGEEPVEGEEGESTEAGDE
ncbi:MAG: 50S ribosomal protein L25/general stress protein Ctc [Rickettsiales bacterium]|nr:50S ribosomal protein L25/general stress protein Ctc [Rickettsiales bacterium]